MKSLLNNFHHWTRLVTVIGMASLWNEFTVNGFAAPIIRELRAQQNQVTKKVTITYTLSGLDRPTIISMELSADGGATYTLNPAHVTGDIGNNVNSGALRQIEWDAALDWPGQNASNARIRLKAVDPGPTDAELDPDTLEFITRATAAASPVNAQARRGLDDFVRESKRLGYWPQMIFVPCREGFGALHQLGGSAKRTNAKFLRQGTTNLIPDGISFTPGPGWTNRVQTPFTWSIADEPRFVSVIGHTNSGTPINPGYSFLRSGTSSLSNLLGTYNCGSAGRAVLMGFSTPASGAGEFLFCNPYCSTVRRPNLAGAQFDGSHTLKSVLNQLYREVTTPTVTTGRPTGPISFFQPAPENEIHVIQAALLLDGDVSALPMGNLWPLIAATYLADARPPYLYYCQGGQSNSTGHIPDNLTFGDWQSPNAALYHYTYYNYGGQRISYWLGADPQNPVRQTPYQSAKALWQVDRPLVANSNWDGVYFWIHGEGDTEQAVLAEAYLPQLQNLARFLREDLRPDLIIPVAQIDYAIQARTSAGFGDFYVTECQGAGTVFNSVHTINQLYGIGNSFTNYSWSSGTLQIQRSGGPQHDRWQLIQNGIVFYTADQSEPHPSLVASWSASNGAAGTPIFDVSRTGNIERVRKAQREFCANDPRSFTVDTRGMERGMDADVSSTDGVHITLNATNVLAQAFAAAWTAYSGGPTLISNVIPLDTRTPLNLWMETQGYSGVNVLPSSIPLNDGLTNLLKYAFNLTAAVDPHATLAGGNYGLPKFERVTISGNEKLRMETLRRKDDSQLKYVAEFWSGVEPRIRVENPVTVVSLDAIWERVTYEAPVSLWNAPRVFAQVTLEYALP
jgi:hypothetical protein